MPRFSRTLLATSISAAFLMPQAQAEDIPLDTSQEMPFIGECQTLDLIDQCLVNEEEPENANQLPINVEADSLEASMVTKPPTVAMLLSFKARNV